MAESSITLETKLRVIGVQVAKGLKAADLKVTINKESFKREIDKAREMLSRAIGSLRVQPQIQITKSSLDGIRKQIRDGLSDLNLGRVKVGVQGERGRASSIDNRSISRANVLLGNFGDLLRDVNAGMRNLRNKLESFAQLRAPRVTQAVPPAGGGIGVGGGGPGGPGGRGGAPGGMSPDDFLLLLTQVPRLDARVQELGETFRRDLLTSLVDTGRAGQEARQRLLELIQTQQQLSTAVGRGPTDPRAVLGREAQKDLQREIKQTAKVSREADEAFKRLGKVGKVAASTAQKGFDELDKTANKLKIDISQLIQLVDRVFAGGRAGAGGGIDFSTFFGKGGAFEEFKKSQEALTKSTQETDKFSRLIEEVGRKAAVFRIAAVAINTTADAITSGARFLLDFESSLREVNKTLQLTEAGLNRLGAAITSLSANTGVSSIEIAGITQELARAGLAGRGFGSVLELTERILIGIQGTTLNATEATEFFIQTIGQLEAGAKGLDSALVTTTKGFDILGRAEDITASKASDVINAFKRSGASLLATGATFEEVSALISVAEERTRRGAEVIGTALKTIATRISNPASEAAAALRSIGVEVIDAQGNLRNIFDVLQDTSKAFGNLTEAQQANIASTVAGVRQVEIFRNIVGSANRQLDVLFQLQGAVGDATRKQAEEQLKLNNILARIQGQFQNLVEAGRRGGLDTFFRLALISAEALLKVVNVLADTFSGLAGTAGAFLIAKGLKLALSVGTRLFAGFTEFIRSISSGTKMMAGMVSTTTVVADTLIRTAQATGANVDKTRQWAAEIERVRAGLAAAQGATVQAGAAGGGGGKDFGRLLTPIAGALGKIGNALTPGRLFAAAAAIQALSLATDEVEASAVKAATATLDMAVNGALLGGAFGPVGVAIGAITGAAVGLIGALNKSKDEMESLSELTRAGFERMGFAIDQLEFDTFAAAVIRADKGLAKLVRTLDSLGPDQVSESAKKIAKELGTIADDPQFLKKGPEARVEQFNQSLSAALARAFELEAGFDISKITELPGDLDLEKLKEVLTAVLSERLNVPLQDAAKLVKIELLKVENNARSIEGDISKLGTSISKIKDESVISETVFGEVASIFSGTINSQVDDLKFLQSQQEKLRRQVMDLRSTGGVARALAEAIAERSIVPQAKQIQEEVQRKLQTGPRAARFEIESVLGKNFFDLSDIIKNAQRSSDDLESAFQDLGQFSKFANEFRRATGDFIKEANDLQAATEKAATPLDRLAQAELRLAERELRRLQISTELARTTGRIELLTEFREQLGELGAESKSFENFADRVFNLFDEMSTLGDTDPAEAVRLLQEAAVDFTKEAQQLGNKEVLSATNKLFKESIDLFIKSETDLVNKRAELRKKEVAATKEQIDNLQRIVQSATKSIDVEEMRNSVLVDQFTSIDKLVKEEQALNRFTELRILELQKELSALQDLVGAADITDDQRKELNQVIADRERELVKITTDAAKKRNEIEKSLLDERIKLARNEADFASSLIEGRTRLTELLSSERKGLDSFTQSISINQKKYQKDIEALNFALAKTANSSLPAAEKERRIGELRKEVAKRTLEAAVAEAEIIQKRKEAVADLVTEGLKNQDELRQAQEEVIEATKQVSDAFNQYVDAVQNVIAVTTDYTLGLQLANIEAIKITGGFRGVKDELNATARAFEEAEQAAMAVGAGEKIVADLRKRSIEEQIRLFNELLSAQQQQARQFFTSSREDQAALFKSIQAVKSLVESGIFGQTFADFSRKGEDAINKIGAQLLSLPQETRQGILDAIRVLKDLGVKVGGFTADELQNVIDTVALGTSKELEVDPLFEVQLRIADLIEEQARLQLDAIVSANEQVNVAKEQLSEARAQKDIAEIQLERLRENAEKINAKIADLQEGLRAPILQQTGVIDSGFKLLNSTLMGFVGSLESFSRSVLTAGGAPGEDVGGAIVGRGNLARQRLAGDTNDAALAFGAASSSLPLTDISSNIGRADRGSNLGDDSSRQTTNELLRRIQEILDNQLGDANSTLTEINERDADEAAETATTTGATTPGQLTAEFNVNIEGQNTVRVVGITEGIQQTVQAIINTFGPFATEATIREQIIQPILDSINKFFIERGLPVLDFT